MRHTRESFIDAAKLVHGDKYDYSKVVYKNIKTKIQIICPVHGVFNQIPDNHLSGSGCSHCAGNQRSNTQLFVEKARHVHGDIYDYSNVDYVNTKTQVEIVCPIHGSFWQIPLNHLQGKGCPRCANNVLLTTAEFVEKAQIVHGDKYGYAETVYYGNRVPVKIKCPEHGVFEQVPYVHLSGGGCPICGFEKSRLSRDDKAIHEKAVQTFLSRYGVDNPMYVSAVREKHLSSVQSDEVNQKRIDTKRKNDSFNTSLSEYRLGELLREKFGEADVFSNYISTQYPYKCDYYIKSRDLYIELNAHWSHGGHWYDAALDERVVTDWMGKSAFYRNAAQTFSERDVVKREVARVNGLNYVVFWKADLSDAKQWFELGCPDGHDWSEEYSWLK